MYLMAMLSTVTHRICCSSTLSSSKSFSELSGELSWVLSGDPSGNTFNEAW